MAQVNGRNGRGVTITGDKEDELKAQLDSYYKNSTTAEQLLDSVAAKTITLSNTTGKPRIEDAKVLLFWHEEKKTGLHHYDIKELGESALFELKNLLNHSRFNGVTAPSFLDFGLLKAKIEAESTIFIVDILKDLKKARNYTPSAWGTRQIAQLGGRSGAAAQTHVANTPHDSLQRFGNCPSAQIDR